MSHLNIEIKARCADPEAIRSYLQKANARFAGTDHQTDTYFNVFNGRLKLREGNIENNLIWYTRSDEEGPKSSLFSLVKIPDASGFKSMMEKATGIKVVVRKQREIYYIENVKFHIDTVEGLGPFMEIEAGNLLAEKSKEELQEQCDYYIREMGIREPDLVAVSYSDLLLNGKSI